MPADLTDIFTSFETLLGYRFADRGKLVSALTHRSFANEAADPAVVDNERLEFLGDAVLSLAISDRLLRLHPDVAEGLLTQLRAELVNAVHLAGIARALQLGEFLRLGRGEARSGGGNKDNLLADALEAVLGAVFLDGGYAAAVSVIERLFATALHSSPDACNDLDAKTRLQELLQGRRQERPVYRLVTASGPDHQRCYEVEVVADGRVLGSGSGRSKKRAEQAAANQALQVLTGSDND